MSPRPERFRKVSNPPLISGMKPYGNKDIGQNAESIFLLYEEYEALRLCDYEMLNHLQASLVMNVSRPTLTRIYARARQKIAEALVKGKQLIIEGGKVYFDSEWYSCSDCGCYFNQPEKTEVTTVCPLCNSRKISNCELIADDELPGQNNCECICVCPKCGYEHKQEMEAPCETKACPYCQITMIRVENSNQNYS